MRNFSDLYLIRTIYRLEFVCPLRVFERGDHKIFVQTPKRLDFGKASVDSGNRKNQRKELFVVRPLKFDFSRDVTYIVKILDLTKHLVEKCPLGRFVGC